jgi:metal-responsive CopG/Arc/MetJ family transcriptional regulator
MKKGTGTKTRISITIDKELIEQINKDCEKNLIKVSTYIEKLIKRGMEK